MPHKLADDKGSAGAVANRISISWAACYLHINLHIGMMSEGSYDTEDRSNNAENSTLITKINYILTYIHIENVSGYSCNLCSLNREWDTA